MSIVLENLAKRYDGHAVVNNTPGVGLRWNAEAVERYTVA